MAPSQERSKAINVAGRTRVLRPRSPTTGRVGKSDVVVITKVVDNEGAGRSGAKKVRAINNKEEMGAASGSTRILRSQSATGRGTDAGKNAEEDAKVQNKNTRRKCQSTGPDQYPTKRVTRSVTKGQAAVVITATRKNPRRKCLQAASKTK